VLVIGGSILNNSTNSCEVHDVLRGNWTAVGSITHRRGRHTASVLTNGKVFVAGGNQNNTALYSTEIY
jgi:N-acetylneuraminic acid mutarotase